MGSCRKGLLPFMSAGLVTVARGTGGALIPRPLDEITLFDIYRAVDCVENGKLFHFHENPSRNIWLGRSRGHKRRYNTICLCTSGT